MANHVCTGYMLQVGSIKVGKIFMSQVHQYLPLSYLTHYSMLLSTKPSFSVILIPQGYNVPYQEYIIKRILNGMFTRKAALANDLWQGLFHVANRKYSVAL